MLTLDIFGSDSSFLGCYPWPFLLGTLTRSHPPQPPPPAISPNYDPNVSSHFHMFLEERNHPLLRTSDLIYSSTSFLAFWEGEII